MCADVFRHPVGVDEQLGFALAPEDGIGQYNRRIGNIEAADVERPRHRVRLCQHHRIVLAEVHGQVLQLFRRSPAGELRGLGGDDARGPWRLIRPKCVDQVARHWNELGANGLAGGSKSLRFARGDQPGIEAEAIAPLQRLLNPDGRRIIHKVMGFEDLHIDLLAHLDGIAAVDEDRCLPGRHDRQSPGPGKAGQPAQTLGIGRHILALELVLARYDIACKFAGLQLRAQERDAAGGFG